MSVTGQMVELASGQPAYLCRPDGAGSRPAVLVIQEAFGLNGNVKQIAERIAAEGYVTLAPDVYWRGGKARTAGYDDLPKALGMMGELNDDEVVADVDAAIAYLRGQSGVRGDRIGITGFCMGGRVSYLSACELAGKIAAAAPFYGGGIPIHLTSKLQGPVLAFFGGDDPFIPQDSVDALKAEVAKQHKQVEVIVYPGAPHGFFCNERDSYRADAAADSWEKLKAFFGKHLNA